MAGKMNPAIAVAASSCAKLLPIDHHLDVRAVSANLDPDKHFSENPVSQITILIK
jgi:hypothetical protein